MQYTPEEVRDFVNAFRGDIVVYEDGSTQWRPYNPTQDVFGGRDFFTAIESGIRKSKKRSTA